MVMNDIFVDVAVPLPRVGVLTYCCPVESSPFCCPGVRIIVRVKNRFTLGIILGIRRIPPEFSCKPIEDFLDLRPVFDDSYLSMLRWMGEYYNYPIGLIFKTLIPSEFFLETDYRLFPLIHDMPADLKRYFKQHSILRYIIEHPDLTWNKLRSVFSHQIKLAWLSAWSDEGYIGMEAVVQTRGSSKTCTVYHRVRDRQSEWNTPEYQKRYPARYKLMKSLDGVTAGTAGGVSGVLIRHLLEDGFITCHKETVQRRAASHQSFQKPAGPIQITARQAAVISEVEACLGHNLFQPFLLHGVTGSGKTEVYLNLAWKCLEMGFSVIVLVPEIALTPKLTWLFRCRLGDSIEVLHSRISSGERYDAWNRIMAGKPVVVIGARSALFAPVYQLALIIVDEEHEQTYKQSGTVPFYQARDTAVKRAQLCQIPILLGSATPSLESYYNSINGKYRLLELPERIEKNPMPDVYVYDLKNKGLIHNLLCVDLFYFIRKCLDNQEQVILFLNRRGYSPYWQCEECGEVSKCPHCDIALTYHRSEDQLVCHYCNYHLPAPQVCPSCLSPHIFFRGLGLEKVEEQVKGLFPNAKIVRMDQDTTRQKDSHYRILKDFEEKKYQILIGTQMVTKGLDFPDVTLVGVLMADVGMNLPDFRAFERTFNLVTQVIGRAGRGKKRGLAVIQTYAPENYCLRFARDQDYTGYARFELDLRQKLNYPPFVHLILIRFQHEDENLLNKEVDRFCKALQQNLDQIPSCKQLLGPAPAPLAKINRFFRIHILIKTTQVIPINRLFNQLTESFRQDKDFNRLQIIYDVDPLQVL